MSTPSKDQQSLVADCINNKESGWIRGIGLKTADGAPDIEYLTRLCTPGNEDALKTKCGDAYDANKFKSENIIRCFGTKTNTLTSANVCQSGLLSKYKFPAADKYCSAYKNWRDYTALMIVLYSAARDYIKVMSSVDAFKVDSPADVSDTFRVVTAVTPHFQLNYICQHAEELYIKQEVRQRVPVYIPTNPNGNNAYTMLSKKITTAISADTMIYNYSQVFVDTRSHETIPVSFRASVLNKLKLFGNVGDTWRMDSANTLKKVWRQYLGALPRDDSGNESAPTPLGFEAKSLFRGKLVGAIQELIGQNAYRCTFLENGKWWRIDTRAYVLQQIDSIDDLFVISLNVFPVLYFYSLTK